MHMSCSYYIMSIDVIRADQRECASWHVVPHTMDDCGHGIMSIDVIRADRREYATCRRAATISICAYGMLPLELLQMQAQLRTCKQVTFWHEVPVSKFASWHVVPIQ
jgi:hypothetical protein